jgi:hypothetical protein
VELKCVEFMKNVKKYMYVIYGTFCKNILDISRCTANARLK